MSRNRTTIKGANAKLDLRPYLTEHDMIDGRVVPTFDAPGLYEVITANRFGEQRIIRNLSKPEATSRVAVLKSRGYPARYRPMTLI